MQTQQLDKCEFLVEIDCVPFEVRRDRWSPYSALIIFHKDINLP